MKDFCTGTNAGWQKYEANPVLGGKYGVCFDISVLKMDHGYKMFFSWRTQKSVAVADSADGICWSEPYICIAPLKREDQWENEINRPSALYKDGKYYLWYTGQYLAGKNEGSSRIFYAESSDGITFIRRKDPVLWPELIWEKQSVMNPSVIWDDEEQLFKMWYSGGEQYEPDAIGYAVSKDGIRWEKKESPVFEAEQKNTWEQQKVGGCQVIKTAKGYIMFYIGYHNEAYAQIGIARSENGISDWYRHPANPVIAPDPGM